MPAATRPELNVYCATPITQTPVTKTGSAFDARPSTGPKQRRSIQTVSVVESAVTAMFARKVCGRRDRRSVELKPSSAASRTAASPPQSRMPSRTKVSETETCELRRGILTASRAGRGERGAPPAARGGDAREEGGGGEGEGRAGARNFAGGGGADEQRED